MTLALLSVFSLIFLFVSSLCSVLLSQERYFIPKLSSALAGSALELGILWGVGLVIAHDPTGGYLSVAVFLAWFLLLYFCHLWGGSR